MINKFVKNLQILYREGSLSLTLLKRMARTDMLFGDITEQDYEYFLNWLEEQENPEVVEE